MTLPAKLRQLFELAMLSLAGIGMVIFSLIIMGAMIFIAVFGMFGPIALVVWLFGRAIGAW